MVWESDKELVVVVMVDGDDLGRCGRAQDDRVVVILAKVAVRCGRWIGGGGGEGAGIVVMMEDVMVVVVVMNKEGCYGDEDEGGDGGCILDNFCENDELNCNG